MRDESYGEFHLNFVPAMPLWNACGISNIFYVQNVYKRTINLPPIICLRSPSLSASTAAIQLLAGERAFPLKKKYSHAWAVMSKDMDGARTREWQQQERERVNVVLCVLREKKKKLSLFLIVFVSCQEEGKTLFCDKFFFQG